MKRTSSLKTKKSEIFSFYVGDSHANLYLEQPSGTIEGFSFSSRSLSD